MTNSKKRREIWNSSLCKKHWFISRDDNPWRYHVFLPTTKMDLDFLYLHAYLFIFFEVLSDVTLLHSKHVFLYSLFMMQKSLISLIEAKVSISCHFDNEFNFSSPLWYLLLSILNSNPTLIEHFLFTTEDNFLSLPGMASIFKNLS